MHPELFPPVGRASAQAPPEKGTRDAMTCITEVLLGLPSPAHHTVSPPERRLPKFRACDCPAASVETEPVKQDNGPFRFQIVERVSRETISVYWSDARTGLYADQLWKLGRARIRSFCVLSGVLIQIGDVVYRPKSQSTGGPANRDFMILADMVHGEFSDVS